MIAVSWDSVENSKMRYVATSKDREMEIEGSPDWVLEIVSRSSVVKDKRELKQAYHAAGIREYWLVDARGADIEFHIFHWRKAGYVSAAIRWPRARRFLPPGSSNSRFVNLGMSVEQAVKPSFFGQDAKMVVSSGSVLMSSAPARGSSR